MTETMIQCRKKNYYFLNTILGELEKFDHISFSMFDTLLLRDVLFPQDIIKLLSVEAEEKYGIKDFRYIRLNIEDELRGREYQKNSLCEDISLVEIYNEISVRHGDFPARELFSLEMETEKRFVRANPLIKIIFDAALKAGKKVYILADTVLPDHICAELLNKCGFVGYTDMFLSGELKKCKHTGSMYRYVSEKCSLSHDKWLHIGDNEHSDGAVPRSLGITAGYWRNPRDWFFAERAKDYEKRAEAAGEAIPDTPLDDSTEFSIDTARRINESCALTKAPDKDVVIDAENISMMFNMSTEKVDSLKEFVIRTIKRQLKFKEFWALKNVSITVSRGEKVGLIGLNGSGKSTMLKIVSGVLKPTDGTVMVKGQTAPMIELGAGFDYELSARENVFLNGAILGYPHEEMERYYDDIISFAELYEYQDVPIKNFSSGMIARLGFAIATCNVPDILIIDEVLAVGDFEFQKKCKKRMEKLTEEGTTVLFVSHSAGDIIGMCDRAVWLDRGKVLADGEARYVVEKYLNK